MIAPVYCPSDDSKKDLRSIATIAIEAGFAAIELTANDDPSAVSVTNVLWSDPIAIHRKLGDLKIGSIAMTGDWNSIERAVIAAVALDCSLIRVTGTDIVTAREHCKLVREVGDLAAEKNVTIAIEPSTGRHAINELWTFLDAIVHPAIGCCWTDIATTTNAAVSIPTLSNWIRAARIKALDQLAINRLHGIGFNGPWIIGPTDDAGRIRNSLAR